MGINHLPALHHYWSSDPIFHYAPVADRISRDHFLPIWRFMHFTHASPPPTQSTPSPSAHHSPLPDRLYKVRPVITTVLAACRAHYRPHRQQAVGEAMVAFKGRSSMKQYLPMKPVNVVLRSGCVQTAAMVTSVSLSVTRDGRVTPPRWGWAVRLSPAL